MATVPDMVRAVVARTPFSRAYVGQRARILQTTGQLPTAVGTYRPAARAEHLTALLFALAAPKAREAPATVERFAGMINPQTRGESKATIEMIVDDIFAGERKPRDVVLTLDLSEPMIRLRRRDGRETRFFEPGQIVDLPTADSVRQVIQIPGSVIAAIGADLGFAGCADAG